MRAWTLLLFFWLICPKAYGAVPKKPLLVMDDQLMTALGSRVPAEFDVVAKSEITPERILRQVSGGGGLVWIGKPDRLPPQLWVGRFRLATLPLSISIASDSPLPLSTLPFRKAAVSSLYIKPAKEGMMHNVNEEPRADLLPVFAASDRFGRIVGYAGALMRYYAPSLAGHRFAGSDCFFFAFDHPENAMGTSGWAELLDRLANHFESHLQIVRVQTGYASYRSGERVQVRATVANYRQHAASVELHFSLKGPGEKSFHEFTVERRVPDGNDKAEVLTDFVAGQRPGLSTIRVEAWQDLRHAEEPGLQGHPVSLDREDIGVVVVGQSLHTPEIINVQGLDIRIDGKEGFWAGTNYFPSSSWWEWLWRDFRPFQAAQDFRSMRRTGYRIVRIWVDPRLDEETMRGLDAAVYLAAQQGIVLDVCVFTQWVRTLGFERPNGEHVRFDYRDPPDFNIYGISLRHIDLQREYVATLARRWRRVGNIIYDLANETYVRNPDRDQIDPQLLRDNQIPSRQGTERDTLLFSAWAREMRMAIREAGATQIIVPGYMFTVSDGGDNYLGNRDAAIEPWHSYASFQATAATLSYEDPTCSHRPVLLEEFGQAGWNSARHYDAMAQAALAAGAAGAMSWEWGVRWLAPELSFESLPLRDFLNVPPDPRFFAAVRGVAEDWPTRSTGINPSPDGFLYGSIYSGTPFPAAAAVDLGRLGLMGEGMEAAAGQESLYVVIPSAPQSTAAAIDKTSKLVAWLMEKHVAFGVLQQNCLGALPSGAHTLVVPVKLTGETDARLAQIRRSGVSIIDLTSSEGANQPWDNTPAIQHIPVTPSNVNLLVRDVADGRLYTLQSRTPVPSVRLSIEHGVEMRLGLTDFAAVRQHGTAVDWIEASGNVSRNGSPICSIEKGGAILASEHGLDLATAPSVRVLATEATAIHFPRKILSIAIFKQDQPVPVVIERPKNSSVLNVDSELVPYVIEVRF